MISHQTTGIDRRNVIKIAGLIRLVALPVLRDCQQKIFMTINRKSMIPSVWLCLMAGLFMPGALRAGNVTAGACSAAIQLGYDNGTLIGQTQAAYTVV